MKEINASEFKTRCLALLDDVARSGQGLTIPKHGRPVAQLLPVDAPDEGYPQHQLIGTVQIVGDVVSPAIPAEHWEAEGRLA